MSGCEYYQELISRMLDEDLSSEENAVLAEHLESCQECSMLYNAFSGISELIEEDMVEAPEIVKANVMAEIRRDEIIKNNKTKKSKNAKRMLAAAACLVLVIAVGAIAKPDFKSDSSIAYDTAAVAAAPAAKAVAAPEAAEGGERTSEAAESLPAQPAEPEAVAEEAALEDSAAAEVPAKEPVYSYGAFSLNPVNDLEADTSTFSILPSWEDISAILCGRDAELTADLLDFELSLSIKYMLDNQEHVLTVQLSDGILYYTDPLDGSFKQSSCGIDAIKFFNS